MVCSLQKPRQRWGEITEAKAIPIYSIFSSWSTRLSTTTTTYHSCIVFFCFCYLWLELLVVLPGELLRPQTPSQPLRTCWTPYHSFWISNRKTCQVSTVPERPKNYVDVDDSDEAGIKTNAFLFPISWSKRNIHSRIPGQFLGLWCPAGFFLASARCPQQTRRWWTLSQARKWWQVPTRQDSCRIREDFSLKSHNKFYQIHPNPSA